MVRVGFVVYLPTGRGFFFSNFVTFAISQGGLVSGYCLFQFSAATVGMLEVQKGVRDPIFPSTLKVGPGI